MHRREPLRRVMLWSAAAICAAAPALARTPFPSDVDLLEAPQQVTIHEVFPGDVVGLGAFAMPLASAIGAFGTGADDERELAGHARPDRADALPVVTGGVPLHLSSSAVVWVPASPGAAATLAVVDPDLDQVAFYDPETLDLRRAVAVGAWPEQLVATPDGTLLVACRGARRVDVIGPGAEAVTRSIATDAEPVALGLTPDASRLVVGHASAGTVAAFDWRVDRPSRDWTLEMGEPIGAVLVHPRGHLVYASPLLGEEIAVLRIADGDWFDSVPLRKRHAAGPLEGRDPFIAQPDEGLDLLAHALRGQKGNLSKRVPLPGVADPDRLRASMARALVPSPSGLRIFAPHAVANQGDSASMQSRFSSGYGGSDAGTGPIAAAITTFESETGYVHIPEMGRDGAARFAGRFSTFDQASLVQAAAHHPTRSLLFVASLGSDRVFALNTRTNTPEAWMVEEMVTGDGPGGLALSPDGGALYVLNVLGRTLQRFDLGDGRRDLPREAAATAELPASPLDEEMLLGRSLFHSAISEISTTGLTCASCHPDGRQDRRVWSLHLGPRQTPMLAGRLQGTAPYDWLGSEQTLEANIRNTISRLNGFGLPDDQREALARYIREGLRGVDNPNRPDEGELDVAQIHGKMVFEDARVGCASCHIPERSYSDSLRYEVGTTSAEEIAIWRMDRHLVVPEEAQQVPAPRGSLFEALVNVALGSATSEVPAVPVAYDTPSLRGVFATPPYFHDGSAPSLRALLDRNRQGDHMGSTSHLDDEELDALVAYLETL